MKKYFLHLGILLLSYSLFGQKHDNVWYVGSSGNEFFENIALNFDNTPVSISQVPEVDISYFWTSTTYSDYSGKLIMYSDGEKIYGKGNNVIEGGGALKGGRNIPHGAYFIPAPNNPELVYLFHSHFNPPPDGTPTIDEFYYTAIDISDENNLRVVEPNVLLHSGEILGMGSAATQHANGRDWWIIIPSAETNTYFKFLLTDTGISPIPSQNIGPGKTLGSNSKLQTFSPDGEKFVEYSGIFGYSLYDFDRCTGELSNEFRLDFNESDTTGNSFGVAFSFDCKLLYVSTSWFTNRFGNTAFDFENPLLIQYDLTSSDIAASADTVGVKDSLPNPPLRRHGVVFSPLQLAPDGKIYSITGNSKIHSIQEPNRKGKACRMMKRFPFVEKGVSTTAPYYPNYRLGPIDGSFCDTLGLDNHPQANFRWESYDTINPLHIEFADLSYYEPADWFWDFEGLGTSRETNPAFTFPTPGIYEVCLTVSNVNSTHTTCKMYQ